MEDSKPRYCKFCLTIIQGEKFEVVENVPKDILNVLLSKLDSDDECKHVMCNVCSAKLSAAREFKSTCLRTEKAINSYVDNGAVFPLDLREIYMKEIENKHVSDDIKICRLCMQPISDVSESIREEYVDMVLKIVPEMNVFIVKEPVACKPCLDSLDEHTKFLKQCSYEEQYGCFSNKQVSDAPSPVPSLDLSLKVENVNDEFEDLPDLIKQERLDVDCEEIENERKLNGQKISSFEEDMEITKVSSKIYKCEECDYKTTNQRYLIDHMFIHKDPSEVQIYKCETCNYKTKSKSALTRHVLLHKNPSESQMYKCENCKFVTTHLTYLKRHMLRHKDASEMQMYKCESCNYKSKHMTDYRKHILVHKDPSEVRMYKCECCSYESKRKKNLAYHMLVHKSPSEVQMYKCENCSYETRYKMNLNRHTLIHKDRTEVHMYQCEHCSYETKFKKDLKSHAVRHKDSSEVQMFICEQCTYETNRKSKLKQHMLKHKDSSEVQMYKCQNCNYESKRKENLKNHMLLHKDPTEVQM